MVLSPDPHLNLRADIKATLGSLQARLQVGGNWRGAAAIARELADKLEQLADMDAAADAAHQPRQRTAPPPPPPGSREEFIGKRFASRRMRRGPQPEETEPPRTVIREHTPPPPKTPELPPP